MAPVWRGLAPKARLALVLPYVQSLGLLPKGLVRRLDAALRGTPQDKHAAAGLIGAIARDLPAALAELRPGAVVQAAAINALAELGCSPDRAVERAAQIVAGLASSNDTFAADDAAAVVDALERLLPGSSAGIASTPANWVELIRRIVEAIMRRWRRSDGRPPPNTLPPPAPPGPPPPATRPPRRRDEERRLPRPRAPADPTDFFRRPAPDRERPADSQPPLANEPMLDLGGGPSRQIDGADNMDPRATGEGAMPADVPSGRSDPNWARATELVPEGSRSVVNVSNPRFEFWEFASHALRDGGRMYLTGHRSNGYTRLPNPERLRQLGLRVVERDLPIDDPRVPEFLRNYDFHRADGRPIERSTVRVVILERVPRSAAQ